MFASGSAAVFSNARLVLLLLAVSSRGRRLCLSLSLTGDSNVKEKKKLRSVSGVDDEFSLSGCSLFYLTREGTAAEIPIYKYKRQNRSHLTPLSSLDSLSH